MSHLPGNPSRLSSQKAFVVQFRDDTAVELGRFIGRIEHVRSGRVEHFQSLDELLAFIGQVLTAVDAEPPDEFS